MKVEKDRIIIDTNIWISFLLTKRFSKLDKIFKEKSIVLLFSEEILDEFLTVATRRKFRKYFLDDDLKELLKQINTKAEFIQVTSEVNICRDPKDNFLLSLAIDGGATHLLSGDKDLTSIQKHGKTTILTFSNYSLKK